MSNDSCSVLTSWHRPVVWLSLLGAAVMTGWDLVMDPNMAHQGHWIWIEGGAFWGVPLQNVASFRRESVSAGVRVGWQRRRRGIARFRE
jgi:uncharacterized membrane protein